MATARSSCIRPTPAWSRLDAKTGKVEWTAKNGDPARLDRNLAPLVVKDKVWSAFPAVNSAVQCHVTAYDPQERQAGLAAFSEGRTTRSWSTRETTELGKPVGKDSSIKTCAGRPVEDRRPCHGADVL